MPKIMKKVQQIRTMLPIGRSDDSSVCTTSFRPGALLITLHSTNVPRFIVYFNPFKPSGVK